MRSIYPTDRVLRSWHIVRAGLSACVRELTLGTDIVQKLDIKALPYVIFMIVPVLGRMSDSDDDIRSTATNTFASLARLGVAAFVTEIDIALTSDDEENLRM